MNTFRMDAPVQRSLLDGSQGVIGRPLARIEGPLKVTGVARYAAEHDLPSLVHGVLAQSTIGAGVVIAIDIATVRAMPGVLDVITVLDSFVRDPHRDVPLKHSSAIRYHGEPIALVVAETFEQARAGALALHVDYAAHPGRHDFAAHLASAARPPDGITPAFTQQGDVTIGMDAAALTVDDTWTTPSQNSAPMEPHAAIAEWHGGRLTLRCAHQALAGARRQVATALGVAPDAVRILAPYVGGGFGAKLDIFAEAVSAAIAARRLARPVKVAMTRQQVFDATVCRPPTRQRLRLGAGPDGRLTTISHETVTSNLPHEDWFEMSGVATHFLYDGANRRVSHTLARLDRLRSASMRGPGEGSGMFALEGAMDELAEQLAMDPIELRRINEPRHDPEGKLPFSTRQLMPCLDEGARRFGWDRRNRTPGGMRRGEWLIGHGVAAAARTNKLRASQARVSITPDGRARVETDMTDIGTGTYTILAQVAAELLGLPVAAVDVDLGDTRHPPAAGSGGSWGASSAGSSVYLACAALRERIAVAIGAAPDALVLKDGHAIAGGRREPLGRLAGMGLAAEGRIEPGQTDRTTLQSSFGGHFCEVHVNAFTGEARVARWLSVIAAGRILNERTARSQCIGGITFGIGAALSEEMVHDPRSGGVVNHDLAGYEVPVHADVPHLDVVFLPERDPFANPLQSKGLGELGVSGSGAAIINAIYNATGRRIRQLPFRIDHILDALPPA